jgi:hypothetical protein
MPDRREEATKLAVLIASGMPLARAAAEAKIPERTARRWANSEAFRRRVAALREPMIDSAIGVLSVLATAAVGVLAEVMTSRTARDADRVRAARAVLAELVRLKDFQDLAERVSRLEAGADERGDRDEPTPRAYRPA